MIGVHWKTKEIGTNMTEAVDNNNSVTVSGEPLFEAAPYQVFTKTDKSGYAVIHKDTGVCEVDDRVLGKCITYAEHSAAFLEEVLNEQEAEKPSDLTIYPAAAMPKGKLN